jgi:hypothetical protein
LLSRSPKVLYVLVFLVGVVLRGIPELLVSWYPVGYETITYYAPPMFGFSERGLVDVFVEYFRHGPLLYALLWFGRILSGAHPFLILKVIGPVLYGCLAVSFFTFLKHGLRFNWKMAFVGTLILIFQVATLRISWDRLRNLLGLTFVFVTLSILKSNYRFKWWFVGIFAVLTALSREYIAFVLFVTVLGFVVLEKKNRIIALIALTPALTVFFFMNFPCQVVLSYIPEGQYVLNGYSGLLYDVFSIFVLCYLPLLLFMLKGFKRDRLFDSTFSWLLLGSFSVVISPWLAVRGYQRWLMLLVFPLSVYAVRGLEHFQLSDKINLKKLVAVILVFTMIGVGYSSGFFSYAWVMSNSWVPVSLVQSSIAWNQVDDVKEVLRWLDENAVFNSSILSEERFYGWTLIYLKRANNDVKVISYGANSSPTPALEKALDNGFCWIYLIWYTDSSLKNFEILYSQNSLSIFRHEL